tara:strand:+ start:1070 stop:1444 length:375 start_codon:yes stop_codon:yes gene_type:complete
MSVDSRQKGARGERMWRDQLREAGYNAIRGQQHSGNPDNPDVICEDLPSIHWEVKCVEKLNIEKAMDQARRDAGDKTPVVAHKRNHRAWLITMPAEEFWPILRGDHLDDLTASAVILGEAQNDQ